jgi:peptide/nickel transport system permease protein
MRRGDVGRMLRNFALILGLAGVVVLGTIALFGPQLSAGDPQAQRLVVFYPDGSFKVPPTPPDAYYPLGTDPLGRDQLARVLWGARLTFTVVLLALLLRATLAVCFGVLGGWRGGSVDAAITLVTNAVAGIPQLLLALLVAVALREHAILGFVVALGCVGWAEGAQFVRAEVMRIRAAPFVEAATSLGTRTRGIITRHLLRSLVPQLSGLFALEAGATLLLLAELGFLGLFMSGGVSFTDNAGRPVLPVRDRAPEWGQMLAGAQQYAFSNQFVAFVPGVVVAAAVFAFNLLGEGARAATDPFSSLSLSPRAVGALGRGMMGVALIGGLFFGVAQARSTELSFDDALRLAREAVERVEPGDELLAAVVRFRSDSHALAKPEKFNFYFRSHGIFEIVRVGFPDADQNAMEVQHDDEDALDFKPMAPLGSWSTSVRDALERAEEDGGRAFRNSARLWLVRVVLTHQSALPVATYRVTYSSPNAISDPNVDVLVDATNAGEDTPQLRLAFAAVRAEAALGGPVALVSASAGWRSASPQGGFGVERPASLRWGFMRADANNDRRQVFVGSSGPLSIGSTTADHRPLPRSVDVEGAFLTVELQGGKAVRDEWARTGAADWFANAFTEFRDGKTLVFVTYQQAPGTGVATFHYDVLTGGVTRTR